MMQYDAPVVSKIVYNSSCRTVLEKVDVVQNLSIEKIRSHGTVIIEYRVSTKYTYFIDIFYYIYLIITTRKKDDGLFLGITSRAT